jgi:hypothetical protein
MMIKAHKSQRDSFLKSAAAPSVPSVGLHFLNFNGQSISEYVEQMSFDQILRKKRFSVSATDNCREIADGISIPTYFPVD